MACVGHASDEVESGVSAEEILMNLHTRFCGCTHVSGNIRINMDNSASRALNETDFDFFYHLEQVSGAILFRDIPITSRIILPNLRLIRGQELLGGEYALSLTNVYIDEFLLPKLTEITRGNVQLNQQEGAGVYPRVCSFARVNWFDIIDMPDFIRIDDNSCTIPIRTEGMGNIAVNHYRQLCYVVCCVTESLEPVAIMTSELCTVCVTTKEH